MSTEIVEAGSTAVAAPGGWESKLAKFAQEAASQEAPPAGTPVTFKAGMVKYGGNPCAGNKLDTVVIASIYENAFYTGEYDPDNPRSPVCFAFGTTEEGMVPHPKAAEPQHATCKGCPKNEWGSADKGKGKACKNIRRLGLLPASPLTVSDIQGGDMAYAKLPVTSVAEWAKYVSSVNAIHKRPPFAVLTQLGAKPDEKSQFKVTFQHIGNAPEELADALIERHERAIIELQVPYNPNSEAPPKEEVPKGKKKF